LNNFINPINPLFSATQNGIFVKTKNAEAKYKKGFIRNINHFAPPEFFLFFLWSIITWFLLFVKGFGKIFYNIFFRIFFQNT
jgi:hypothetical protein